MRNLRKLLLLAVGLIAALALAPTASAQSVELYDEDEVTHCSDVVMTHHLPSNDPNCTVHALNEGGGTADLYLHTGMVEAPFSQCNNEFEAAFDEDGHGWIYNQVLTPEPPPEEQNPCAREPCDEGESGETPHRNLAWEAQLSEAGPNTEEEETLRVTFCLYAHSFNPASEGTAGTPCVVDLDVVQADHNFHVSSPPHDGAGNGGAPCINLGGAVELEGAWQTGQTENHPEGVYIHHLDDEAG